MLVALLIRALVTHRRACDSFSSQARVISPKASLPADFVRKSALGPSVQIVLDLIQDVHYVTLHEDFRLRNRNLFAGVTSVSETASASASVDRD